MAKLTSASMLGVALLLSAPTASVHAAPSIEPTTPSFTARKKPAKHHVRKPQTGKASYYANRFNGRRTASGHLFYQDAYTAAHRTLPLGTWVKVTNTRNQRSVVVQITDRGPFADASRIIDLSQRSASELEMREAGVVPVRLEVVQEFVKPEA
jgi:rare lipoprotein A